MPYIKRNPDGSVEWFAAKQPDATEFIEEAPPADTSELVIVPDRERAIDALLLDYAKLPGAPAEMKEYARSMGVLEGK